MKDKEMSRQLEYYYRNKEKINKKFAEKYRNNIEFRDAWKEKNKNEQKEHRKSTKILTELEDYLNQKMGQQNLYDYQKLAYQNIYLKIKRLKEEYK